MTFRWTLLAASALTLQACATMVSDQPNAEYAPQSEPKTRSGVVSYNPTGIKEVVDARRNDAFKKMVEFCGSRNYKINKEETVPASSAKDADSIATFGANEVRQIHFSCL